MNFAIISPFPPFRGGISKETEVLSDLLISKNHKVKIISYKKLYPNILFPGKTQYLKEYKINNNIVCRNIINTLSPLTWRKAYFEIISSDIDIILFRYWHPILIPVFLYLSYRLRRRKIFCICDNVFPHEKSNPIDKFFVKKMLQKFNGIFTMSNNVSDLIKNKIPNSKVKTIFLPLKSNFGPLVPKEIALNKLNIMHPSKVILFFGLIRIYKGLDILIKAFSKLISDNNSYKLIIAGECYDDKNKYLKLIEKYKLSKNIIWFDEYIDDGKVNLFFSACDLVVLPYKKASQSGIIPIAYNYNKLVVASNIDGLKEHIVNKKTGYLFDSNQHKSLYVLLNNIFAHHNFIESENYISKYKNNFSINKLYDYIISFIDNE